MPEYDESEPSCPHPPATCLRTRELHAHDQNAPPTRQHIGYDHRLDDNHERQTRSSFRTHGLFQYLRELPQMLFHGKALRDGDGASSQIRIVSLITEAFQNRLYQAFCGGRITWSKMPAYAVDEPCGNAADVKGRGGQALKTGLNADYAEGFRPEAWHDEQIRSVEQMRKLAVPPPAWEIGLCVRR